MAHKKILFEGDSWFAYPNPGVSNVYEAFKFINGERSAKERHEIYFQTYSARPLPPFGAPKGRPLSRNGDTIAEMASEENGQLWNILDNRKVDALVLSGGGNDIVDRLCRDRDILSGKKKPSGWKPLLKRWNATATKPTELINGGQLTALLKGIEGDYKKILARLGTGKSKGAQVLAHDYTFLKPSGIPSKAILGLAGVFGNGPWLKPSLVAAGYPAKEIDKMGQKVCDHVMRQFSKTLAGLQTGNKNFCLVSSQKVDGLDGYLIDELHLNRTGCMFVAIEIMKKL